MDTLMRITSSTEATPGAKERSPPITPTRPIETPNWIRKKVYRKGLARIQQRPQKLLPRLYSRKVLLTRRSTC